MTGPLIVLAAGGTGGHLFPAEALARALLSREARPVLLTDRRGGAFDPALGDVETHRVRSGGVAGKGLVVRALSVREIAIGVLQARTLLRRLAPAAVVGFGGYASLPATLAAVMLRIPLVAHEQNAVLGRANRLLARGVDRIATAFPSPRHLGAALRAKAVHTGMPVRPAFALARSRPYPKLDEAGPLRLLILGGSQGARIFSDIVPEAVGRLPEEHRQRLGLAQQCRPEDLERVRAAYDRLGIAADLAAFFSDVPERLASAHLVIARAGASTVAELATVGRPAILVPYPFATDDHQSANAAAVAEAGGAWLVPQPAFTADGLAALISSLVRVRETLPEAAARAARFGVPEAAERLADLVMTLAGSNGAGNPVALGNREAA
ncbi:MAG: undecaprenyldiphospho-muramoylpentapeptide beta-N-acetylglucosaminyltransferase [Rhodospirillales bacterium]|nr:MAG: undecaprenyldiphospho-muramoylpentapeptide beta-N-acetylglucosaminyltransferase [Rhodospirillales bacterium]